MLKKLCLHNFKCFEAQCFDLADLTLLAGLNGTGKSSVLQSVLLLRQSYDQRLLQRVGLAFNGELVQLGTARDVFFEGAATPQFGFDLTFISVGKAQETVNASWQLEYDRVADVVKSVGPAAPEVVYEQSLFTDDFHYLAAERLGPRIAFPISDYQVRERAQLGTQGQYVPHFLSLYGSRPIDQASLLHPLGLTNSLADQVEAWMSEVSPGVRINTTSYTEIDQVGLVYSFSVGRQVSNPYRSTNVGFGITYTLPVVVALLSSVPGSLVLLENPEAHLHPQGQAKMGELMVRAAAAGTQIIVETHSDHVLNGVRIAVREGLLPPERTQLHFMQRDISGEQLSSEVISPRIDRNGRIDRWPNGFFDEWDKSLERLL